MEPARSFLLCGFVLEVRDEIRNLVVEKNLGDWEGLKP